MSNKLCGHEETHVLFQPIMVSLRDMMPWILFKFAKIYSEHMPNLEQWLVIL